MRHKTFFIETLGCKINQYDSQIMREQFKECGLTENKNADLNIVNTCTVTHKADRQARNIIYKFLKRKSKSKIVVTGCYAHASKNDLMKIKGIDLIIDNENKFRIPQLLGLAGKASMALKKETITGFDNHSRAFIKIQDGCNNFCSYCIVPLVRGRSKSKKAQLIKREFVGLLENGFKEIVLCGICLGDYGKDLKPKVDLSDILGYLTLINREFRIRLSSIEADDVNKKLLALIRDSKKICRHLHIPFQSGDDKMLKLMKRNFTVKDYLKKVELIRNFEPEIALTTDMMVGFPFEGEENFKNTVKFLNCVRPMRMHIFSYSPRSGTCAHRFKKNIPTYSIIQQRRRHLEAISRSFSYEYRKSFINKNLDVLIESKDSRMPGLLKGYSDNYIMINVKQKHKRLINKLVTVKVKKITFESTAGVIT